MKDVLVRLVPKSARVLMVGCGNSVMSEAMVLDGYERVVNIDISGSVVATMNQRAVDKGISDRLVYQQARHTAAARGVGLLVTVVCHHRSTPPSCPVPSIATLLM